jgi:curved DNA-binding protein CbpA
LLNHYQQLGLSESASADEIKKVFRRLAMQYHPDRNHAPDAAQRFVEIQEAYEILSDPVQKASYDNMLRAGFTSFTFESTFSDGEVPIDPFTGQKNYKYHRGKRKKERNLDEPFENFDEKYGLDFETSYSTLGRVVLLGIPGYIASLFIGSSMFDEELVNVCDIAITAPFILFHLFILLDCALEPNSYYGLLIKVTDQIGSFWKELMISITERATKSLDYNDMHKSEWVREKIYIHDSSTDFSNVQQFTMRISMIFKIKLRIFGIVDKTETNIQFNPIKAKQLFVLSCLQLVFLSVIFFGKFDSGNLYLFLVAVQIAHIFIFITGSRVFSKHILKDLTTWF